MKTALPLFDIFDHHLNHFGITSPENQQTVPIDIYRTRDSHDNFTTLNIDLAVSGLNPDDINISLEDDVLTIAHTKTSHDDQRDYQQRNISRKNWTYQYRLIGKSLDRDSIRADYEQGLLKISIPIHEEFKSKKTIKVNVSNAITHDPQSSQLKAA